MKKLKLAIFLLSAAAVLGVASCSSKNNNNSSNSGTKVVKPEPEEPTTPTEPKDDEPVVTFTRSNHSITNIKVETTKTEIDELVIPDEIDETTITSLDWRSFSDSSLRNKKIKKLVIGKNINDISFYDTKNKILDIEISSENSEFVKSGKFVTSKDYKTLYWAAPNFDISELPSTIEVLGSYSFINYTSSTLTLPSQIKTLENNAIPNEIDTVTLNEGLTTIKDSSLNIKYITVPTTVTSIRYNSFGNKAISLKVASGNPKYDSRENCDMIIETATNKVIAAGKLYSFPSSVTAIGDSAFGYTYNFTSITIPSTVTRIDSGAFRSCYWLESINLPSNVDLYKSNGTKATDLAEIIYGCGALKSFSCPNTITELKLKYYGLNNLEKIYIPVLTSIEADCFANTPKLTKIYTKMTQAQWEALNYQDTSDRLNDIEIIYNSTSIGS